MEAHLVQLVCRTMVTVVQIARWSSLGWVLSKPHRHDFGWNCVSMKSSRREVAERRPRRISQHGVRAEIGSSSRYRDEQVGGKFDIRSNHRSIKQNLETLYTQQRE